MWTDPVETTVLQNNISMATVEQFALHMYVDMTVAGSSASVAGSAASVAGSAVRWLDQLVQNRWWLDQLLCEVVTMWGRVSAQVLLQSSRKATEDPSHIFRCYEMQIAVVTTTVEPSK